MKCLALVAVAACHTTVPTRTSSVQTLHLVGTSTHGGLTGPFERWDTATGEHREVFGGADSSTQVFDGTRGWLVDRNHVVRELDGPELLEQRSITFLMQMTGSGTVTLTPPGGKRLTLTFDPATHHLVSLARPEAEKIRTLKLSDWRTVSGVLVPFVWEDTTGDPADALHVKLDRVEVDHPAPAFTRPADATPDWKLATAHVVIPLRIIRGLPVADVQVNGGAPMSFIVDTGAEVTVINDARVAALKLNKVGALSIGGGGGDIGFSYLDDVSYALPGVTVAHQMVAAVPLDSLEPLFGHPIDGILGYDFLSRFAVELDYDRKTMTLSDPKTFNGTGTLVPITLEDSVPHADATITAGTLAPLPGHFVVDTGCSCEVDLNSPFTRIHKLVEATPNVVKPPPGTSRGVGGETEALMGRLTAIQIAGLSIAKPIADFGQDTVGGNADPETAGLLGSSLWRRFVVQLDYSHKKMWLTPGPGFAASNDPIGIGAVWVMKPGSDEHAILVAQLMDKGPAATAGFLPGDLLVSLDGTPVAKLTVDDAGLPNAKAGDKHTYVVDRAGKHVTISVVAASMF